MNNGRYRTVRKERGEGGDIQGEGEKSKRLREEGDEYKKYKKKIKEEKKIK